MDGDLQFRNRWGGDGSTEERAKEATKKMVQIFAIAQEAFKQNLYDGSLMLKGTMLHLDEDLFRTGGNPTTTAPKYDPYNKYGNWLFLGPDGDKPEKAAYSFTENPGGIMYYEYYTLDPEPVRGDDLPAADEVCANVLMTHKYTEGVLGLSPRPRNPADYQGSDGIFGSLPQYISEMRTFGASNSMYVTTGCSTCPEDTTIQATQTLTHELLHHHGAPHLDSASNPGRTEECYADGAGYLMKILVPLEVRQATHFNVNAGKYEFSPCTTEITSRLIHSRRAVGTAFKRPTLANVLGWTAVDSAHFHTATSRRGSVCGKMPTYWTVTHATKRQTPS
jgi:hypothetical protein